MSDKKGFVYKKMSKRKIIATQTEQASKRTKVDFKEIFDELENNKVYDLLVGREKYPEHFLSRDAIDTRKFYRLVDKFECVSWNSLFVFTCPLRWNSKFSQ